MNNQTKILLIEDNGGDAELIVEALKNTELDIEIELIDNGESAINFLKSQAADAAQSLPDLIFLDINLPKVDGKEVLNFVKHDDELKTIPVIMLTSSSLQKDILDSYNNHANCYIVKPDTLIEFMNMINSAVSFWVKCVTYPEKK